MIYIALALVAALALVSSAFASLLRGLQREHNRRESLMLDQILHLSGRTWTPPPAEVRVTVPDEPWAPRPVRFTASPEQFPAYE